MTDRSIMRAWAAPGVLATSVLLAGLAFSPTARAQTLNDAATAIETLLEQGRNEEAVSAARAFLRSVTARTGFGVTNARLIEGPATGFGIYQPRDSNVFGPGEPVFAYVEVYGFSLTPLPNGPNRLMFDVDFTLDSTDGHQMTDAMVTMGEIRMESYSDPVDGYFHLTYRVTGVEGAYILRTHVTDRASGQTTEFTLPVVFGAPEAAGAEMDDK